MTALLAVAVPVGTCVLFVAGVIAWEAIQDKRRRDANDEISDDCTCEPGVMEPVPPIAGCPVHEPVNNYRGGQA